MTIDPDGGLLLVGARAGWLATLAFAFGSLVFRILVAPRALARMPDDPARRLATRLAWIVRSTLLACLPAALAWLLLQTADLADSSTLSDTLAEVPTVIGETRFGQVLAAQIALLAVGLLCFGRGNSARWRVASVLPVALSVLLEADHGHAGATDAAIGPLLIASALHLLGAGAWLGALPPLLLTVWTAPARAAAAAARYFTPLGKLCVAAVLLSAFVQAFVLVGGIPALFGTAYGTMVLVKSGLFLVLLGLALANRYRLAPALLRGKPGAARRALGLSVALQIGAGITAILAAALLASLPPGAHVQGR